MGFQNNKGLTLIELIVAIAIVGIVSVSIVSFMVMGANSYKKANSDINLQYEAQLTMNQLQDMVIDADKGITYERKGETETENVLDDSSGSIAKEDIKTKSIMIYNQNNAYKIEWNREEKKLYYYKYMLVESGGVIALSQTAGPALMADYISGMQVNLNRLSTDRVVRIDLDFTLGTKNYSTYSNITLRNQVKANSEPDEIYDGTLEEGDGSLADGITLTPKTVVLWPGNTQTFAYQVTNSAGGYPSQDANWVISGNSSSQTTISDGVLTVASDETASSIVVKTSAKHTQSGTEVSDTSQVLIKQVSGVAVAVTSGGTFNNTNLYSGDTIQLEAIVSGANIEAENSYDQEVSWSILQGSASSITKDGFLSVEADAETDSEIIVEARSMRNNEIAGTMTFTIEEGMELALKTESETTQIYRNASLNLTAELTKVKNPDAYTIQWEYDLKNVDNDEDYASLAATQGLTNTLYVNKNLDTTKEYKIEVTAILKKDGVVVTSNGQSVTATLTLTIPKVKIRYKNFGIDTYSETLSTYLTLGQTTYVYYEIVGIIMTSNPSWSVGSGGLNRLGITSESGRIKIKAKSSNNNINATVVIYMTNGDTSNAVSVHIKNKNIQDTSYYSPPPDSVDFIKEGGIYYYSDTILYSYGKVSYYSIQRWKLEIYVKDGNGNWNLSATRYWNSSYNEWRTSFFY
ncbi:prepilin-type N-terminal cleavage/methylation domain-containing protein [Lachnotalea glycerini]|uniref:Prepilin-type N-terminal cleavage/methylation domain-containing protein n=1 Tax=Lachnotalea glycerini TaxID=1763509 RepID=A0A318ETT6_9FIRM|nr:prepilin-type N-terminal cleavage/methylation domain-containing protein [Lachnotalea glycerini]PXV93319.1 prepilin-type N-terminal cleavage/methylation domain-containing protein [Lachnotalea glycerini]